MKSRITQGTICVAVIICVILGSRRWHLPPDPHSVTENSFEPSLEMNGRLVNETPETPYEGIAECGLHVYADVTQLLAAHGVPSLGEGSRSLTIYVPRSRAHEAARILENEGLEDVIVSRSKGVNRTQ